MNRLTLKITEHGLVDVPEQVTSQGSMVVARGHGVIVVKHPGRRYYRGMISPWGYAPGEYVVYRIDGLSIFTGPPGTPGLPEFVPVEQIARFPLRSNGPAENAYGGVKSDG